MQYSKLQYSLAISGHIGLILFYSISSAFTQSDARVDARTSDRTRARTEDGQCERAERVEQEERAAARAEQPELGVLRGVEEREREEAGEEERVGEREQLQQAHEQPPARARAALVAPEAQHTNPAYAIFDIL